MKTLPSFSVIAGVVLLALGVFFRSPLLFAMAGGCFAHEIAKKQVLAVGGLLVAFCLTSNESAVIVIIIAITMAFLWVVTPKKTHTRAGDTYRPYRERHDLPAMPSDPPLDSPLEGEKFGMG